MSEQPRVLALCLTANRQSFTDRAVRCFLAQTYDPKALVIYDTGSVPYQFPEEFAGKGITVLRPDPPGRHPIGKLRNDALSFIDSARGTWEDAIGACAWPQVVCHWDSDDISAPERIADQVKLLVDSGMQAVGYREMMFWKRQHFEEYMPTLLGGAIEHTVTRHVPGEAWLYRNTMPSYIVGTSLCYWMDTWRTQQFPECMIGEDRAWIRGLKTLGTELHWGIDGPWEPMMIAEIHGGNTCKNVIDTRGVNPDRSPQWVRQAHDDDLIRQILEAA